MFPPSYLYLYIKYMVVNNGVKSDYIEKKIDNLIIQAEGEKQSQHYNVSVLMNIYQDWEGSY